MNTFDITGTTAATQIAAEEARLQREEEEELTPYSRDDLAEDWEFKILRSATSGFKNPERLQSILQEEARAGWVLVEKFDNSRVRLKRPADAKRDDRGLGFDPYRTNIGMSSARLALTIVAVVIAAVVIAIVGIGEFVK